MLRPKIKDKMTMSLQSFGTIFHIPLLEHQITVLNLTETQDFLIFRLQNCDKNCINCDRNLFKVSNLNTHLYCRIFHPRQTLWEHLPVGQISTSQSLFSKKRISSLTEILDCLCNFTWTSDHIIQTIFSSKLD